MGYRHHIRVLLVLTFLIVLSNSTLSLYNRQSLPQSDEELDNIKYSIANYGFAPYLFNYGRFGKTLIGKLTHAPDFGK